MEESNEIYEKVVSIIEEGVKPLDQLYTGIKQRIELLEMQLKEAQAKAAAYDRIKSGSVRGMKEWANILGKPVAIDDIGRGISDWTTSLTLPDGWEEVK